MRDNYFELIWDAAEFTPGGGEADPHPSITASDWQPALDPSQLIWHDASGAVVTKQQSKED